MYEIIYTKRTLEAIPKLKAAKLHRRAMELIDIIRENPYQTPPAYEKLSGNMQGAYARRINIQHRLVYEVLEDTRQIKIISMWSHYAF